MKRGSKLSTNIDYLLVNKKGGKALLVELKTERQGNPTSLIKQLKAYRDVKSVDRFVKSIKLVLDAKNRRARHKTKYDYLRKQIADKLERIKEVKLLYLIPGSLKEILEEKKQDYKIDYIVEFKDLEKHYGDQDWDMIYEYLQKFE